jgi:copper chaperone NosL
MKKLFRQLITILFLFSLFACSESKQQQVIHQAEKIASADECHLCGMLISELAGPKGELYQKNDNKIKKFCSTRDLLSYYLDPEHQRNISQIFVHDMSKMPWGKTNDSYFIDAHKAWFVSGSTKMAAMGKTLASFSKAVDAKAFAQEFGGKVLTLEQIKLSDLL